MGDLYIISVCAPLVFGAVVLLVAFTGATAEWDQLAHFFTFRTQE